MKKRVIFNLLLFILIVFLAFLLYKSIEVPIDFKQEKSKRELAVVEKLIEVRKAQEAFRGVTGGFAPTFDSLKYVLENDSFQIIKIFGNPDDPNFTGEITYDTTYLSAIDSINNMGLNLDSLRYVPYGNGVEFNMDADTLTYQSTMVKVVEVGIKRKVFMGKYASPSFKKYDDSYDPEKVMKFGDLNKPTLAGNWEN